MTVCWVIFYACSEYPLLVVKQRMDPSKDIVLLFFNFPAIWLQPNMLVVDMEKFVSPTSGIYCSNSLASILYFCFVT